MRKWKIRPPCKNRTTQQQQQPFYGTFSGTTRVSWYQKKHSPTHYPDHRPIFISFFHLPWSIASSLFQLRAWQSFCTISFHVLFGLPLGLEPSTSYSIHFFTQSVSSFRSTCPYHRNLFCCSINIISSIPSLSLNSLLGTLSSTLTLHIHLTILISARWSATSFSFLTGEVSLAYSIRERPIRVKRPMSDVPIFRWKNSDVWFRCLVVRSCFSRPGGRPHLTIVSHLPGRPTAAIWMRVGGANYVIARGWRWRGALK